MIATQTKTITISSSKPTKEILVEILPDDTAAAILEKAGLSPRDMLMKPSGQEEYPPTSLPFADVTDGGKLHVVPFSGVGKR